MSRNPNAATDLRVLGEFPLGTLVVSKRNDHPIERMDYQYSGEHWRNGPIMGYVTGYERNSTMEVILVVSGPDGVTKIHPANMVVVKGEK